MLFRRIVFFISVLIALGLVFASLASHIDPEQFWPAQIVALLYPVLLLISLPSIIILSGLHFKSALALTIGIALSWTNAGRFMSLNPEQKPLEHQLKVVTYNAHTFGGYYGMSQFKKRNDQYQLLKSTKADIICIQEFYTNSSNNVMRELKNAVGMQYTYFHATSKRSGHETGLAILSRYPLNDIEFTQLGSKNSFGVLQASVSVQNKQLTIYNTYLQSFFVDLKSLQLEDPNMESTRNLILKLKYGFMRRSKQVLKLQQLLQARDKRIILCGDFNDTPSSLTYNRLAEHFEDAFRSGFRLFGPTFNSLIPIFRIDYILHSPDLRASDYAILNDASSDHRPVVSVISFE